MKTVVSEIFLAIIVTVVVHRSHAAKLSAQDNDGVAEMLERQQVKREVMTGSSPTNLQGDGKSFNGPPAMGIPMNNMQAFARYPNYAGLTGVPVTGPGLMMNVAGVARNTGFPSGFGGAGYPGSIYPYEMNYENIPTFAGGSFLYGGAYPGGAYPGGAYPGGAYPGGAYPVNSVAPQFGFSSQQPQNYPGQQIPTQQQIPGQYPQSQLAQQQLQAQQQQQFLVSQPQQQQQLGGLQVLPSIYPQFGYSPAFRGYQYTIGGAI